ncbi:cytochrome P450 CYP109C2 [Sulfobacillus acidophilus TPY]|nr:cytochrome P450 CYP109C2 [Sulfobacillus acidophilus TPY]
MIVWLGAANRNPVKFPEPDTLLPHQMPNPHMAFGFGIHTCVAALLERLEARTVIPLFWRETRLDPMTTPPDQPSHQGILFGVDCLPVRIRSVHPVTHHP